MKRILYICMGTSITAKILMLLITMTIVYAGINMELRKISVLYFLYIFLEFVSLIFAVYCLKNMSRRYHEKLELKAQKQLHKEMQNEIVEQKKLLSEQIHEITERIEILQKQNDLYKQDHTADLLLLLESESIHTNLLLDTLLQQKKRKAQENGIEINIQGYWYEKASLKEIELISFMSNLLDNAIEAAMLSKEKQICVRLDNKLNLLHIKIDNTLAEGITVQLHMSTKNGRYHGYGNRIIQDIITQNDGEIRTWQDEKGFHQDIFLNTKNQEKI